MNLIDHMLNSVHYFNKNHRTLSLWSWNIQKIIANLTRRYSCTKTDTGLILQEVVEYEIPKEKSVKQ